jgi:hypothetical protein
MGTMTEWLWILGTSAVLGVLLTLVWRPLRRLGREMHAERARESFRLQRERLEAKFFDAAAASGKPRGLHWKECSFENPVELARDRRSGQLIALVSVAIAFEAVAGGPMEGVEAVGNLRNATAVFVFERGHWTTHGKAIFNMNPDEALRHFQQQYERVEAH